MISCWDRARVLEKDSPAGIGLFDSLRTELSSALANVPVIIDKHNIFPCLLHGVGDFLIHCRNHLIHLLTSVRCELNGLLERPFIGAL